MNRWKRPSIQKGGELFPAAGGPILGGGSDKVQGMWPETKCAAEIVHGFIPGVSASQLYIHVVENIPVTGPAVGGYFKIRPDQCLPNVELLDSRLQRSLVGCIRQRGEFVNDYRKHDAKDH